MGETDFGYVESCDRESLFRQVYGVVASAGG
jgi:hypothetical protein